MKNKKVYLISYDAFSTKDWEFAATLPNFSELIRCGTYSRKLKSVYPSLTYVAHTTMVTGMYPANHGVYHNCPFQPFVNEKNQKWFWYFSDIKSPTIYEAAKNAGRKTAGILWPVSGKSPIKYNMPEIKAVNKENQILKILKTGSKLFCISLERKYGKERKGIEQPYLDNYSAACVIDTIINKNPDLLLVHFIELDDVKHAYGIQSNKVKEAIINMDERLGRIMKTSKENGSFEDTVFIILGDHGQLDVEKRIDLNNILRERGLIITEDNKQSWDAYVQSAGGAAFLFAKDENSKEEAKNILNDYMKNKDSGIEKIFYEDEFESLNIKGEFVAVLEAKKGSYFADNLIFEKSLKATHGYLPEKDEYYGNIIIAGNGIKQNYEIGILNMTDIAPTIAKIMGIPFNECDGRVIEEIII